MAFAVLPLFSAFALLGDFVDEAAAQPAAPAPAPSSSTAEVSPPLAWQGAQRLQLQCVVTSDRPAEDGGLGSRLCNRTREILAQSGRGASTIIPIGDPSILAADAVTLLVHGSVQQLADRRLLSFTMRPHRVSSEQTTILFGTAPAIVDLGDPRAAAATDRALRTALAATMPSASSADPGQPTS